MSIFRACSKKRKVKFSYYRDKLDFWTTLVADLTKYDTFLYIFPLFEHLEHGPTNAMNKDFYLCGKWNVYFNFYTQIICIYDFTIFKKILNNHAILNRFVRIEYIISYL